MSRYTYDKTSKELDMIAGVPAMDGTPVEDSVKPITSGGVYDVVDEFTQINNELGTKNLCPNYATTQTINDVTFTVNSDGSVALSGTASTITDFPLSTNFLAFNQIKEGDILSGCPEGGDTETYCLICGGQIRYATDTGNGDTLNNIDLSYGYRVAIRIRGGVDTTGLVFKPMIRPAYITDDTYEPYARTNQELTGEVEPMLNELGAKNLLPNDAVTQIVSGITWTVNSDGTVTANGTATANSSIATHIYNEADPKLVGKRVKLSGCPIGGGQNKYSIEAFRVGVKDGSGGTKITYGDEIEFTWENDSSGIKPHINLVVMSGVTVSNLVFKPMLRLASIKDDTYVPYAMTNRELTGIAQSVQKNSYGPAVEIKEYNTENHRYTCPCDGYLRLQAVNSTSSAANAIVFGADGNTGTYSPTISVRYANGNTFNSMFVRRGMQIYIKDNTQNDLAFFIPLV